MLFLMTAQYFFFCCKYAFILQCHMFCFSVLYFLRMCEFALFDLPVTLLLAHLNFPNEGQKHVFLFYSILDELSKICLVKANSSPL